MALGDQGFEIRIPGRGKCSLSIITYFYPFPVDLALIGIPIGANSIEKW